MELGPAVRPQVANATIVQSPRHKAERWEQTTLPGTWPSATASPTSWSANTAPRSTRLVLKSAAAESFYADFPGKTWNTNCRDGFPVIATPPNVGMLYWSWRRYSVWPGPILLARHLTHIW